MHGIGLHVPKADLAVVAARDEPLAVRRRAPQTRPVPCGRSASGAVGEALRRAGGTGGHSLTVLSRPPLSSCRPLGAIATAVAPSGMGA